MIGAPSTRKPSSKRPPPLKTALLCACLLALPAILAAEGPATVPCAQAKGHVGERVTVVGPVSGVHVTGKGDTFINLGPEYPRHDFTAVIFSADTSKFDNLDGLEGRTVAVTGTVKEYHGKPEIIVKEPAQLKIK